MITIFGVLKWDFLLLLEFPTLVSCKISIHIPDCITHVDHKAEYKLSASDNTFEFGSELMGGKVVIVKFKINCF